SIVLTVIGGVEPYSYSWKHSSASTQALTGLSSGDYEVTVRDKNLCEIVLPIKISQPSKGLSIITKKVKDVTGNGLSNGEIRVEVEGGTPDYTYEWSGVNGVLSNNTSTLSGIKAGTYTLKVTDIKGCELPRTYKVEEPLLLEATIEETAILCNGGEGKLSASVKGGVEPYRYEWRKKGSTTIEGVLSSLEGVGSG
ncbi:SprB repeat-containing protein, partial [Tenacibaculum sp. S7007]